MTGLATSEPCAWIAGLEHNLYDVDGNGRDFVLIAEYARDSRRTSAHSGFQNDLTLGGRLVWNDVEDKKCWRSPATISTTAPRQ